MRFIAWTIYDKVAMQYSLPKYSVNSEVAKREFKLFCAKVAQENGEPTDFVCYGVGEFDIQDGKFIPFKNILEIEKGE